MVFFGTWYDGCYIYAHIEYADILISNIDYFDNY